MTDRPILHRQHMPECSARYHRDTLTAEQADNIRRERERGWHRKDSTMIDPTRAALIAELARLRDELRATLTTKGEVQ